MKPLPPPLFPFRRHCFSSLCRRRCRQMTHLVSNAEESVSEDIIYNIISRLPTKSLLRFKCVSKHWNSVISNHSFMKFRSRRMIFLPLSSFRIIDILDRSVIKLKSPAGLRPYGLVHIVGSFNGIVLIKQTQDRIDYMMLYNPFTTAFKRVPDTPLRDTDYAYGFGYGTTPNDIKIVRLRKYYERLESRSCDIFSVGSWSTPAFFMGDYTCIELQNLHGVFVNGFLYWMAFGDSRPMVVALDLTDMSFSHIQLPPNYNFSYRTQPQISLYSPRFPLSTLNGRLCMICSEGNSYENELWVLNEDGIGKIWLKLHPLPSLKKVTDNLASHYTCILNEGKLVLRKQSDGLVFIYNFLKDSYEEIYDAKALTSLNLRFDSQAAVEYVESLVSPSDLCSGFV